MPNAFPADLDPNSQYDSGATIYEEIEEMKHFKYVQRCAHEREEGYVSINTHGQITKDIVHSTLCEAVSNCKKHH